MSDSPWSVVLQVMWSIVRRGAEGMPRLLRTVQQGTHNKHDTARLRFIKSIALPGIRWGKLVPDDDMRMLVKLGRGGSVETCYRCGGGRRGNVLSVPRSSQRKRRDDCDADEYD